MLWRMPADTRVARDGMTFVQFSVVLSVAKACPERSRRDLIAACHGHEILRCAQDDIGAVAKRRPKVGSANCANPRHGPPARYRERLGGVAEIAGNAEIHDPGGRGARSDVLDLHDLE